MVVEDDKIEGSISSLIIESLESNRSGGFPSPEDLAWVDSCLIEDPEISDNNWNAMKDALLEIVNDVPEPLLSSPAGSDSFSGGMEHDMLPLVEEAETTQFLGRNDNVVSPISLESETNDDSCPINQKTDIASLSELFHSDTIETIIADPFLPTYKEGDRVSEVIDSGFDLDTLTVEIEPLSENIFKVWDLGVPTEEEDDNELETQLKKALTETSLNSTPPSVPDDSVKWKYSKDESLNNLIAGIADLSLNQVSS